MSTEEPEAITQPLSSGPKEEKKKKKRKKKKRDKSKKSIGGIRRGAKGSNKSYGANPRFNRRESIPHHATVQSLASINQPVIVNQLTKMSQDLKYHRELQKALMELKQKDEDYRYAIEIGESLTKENQFLKEQVELIESQLHTQETDNDILKEKLETLSQTYHQDLYKYHQDLQAHKELVNELTKELSAKNEELSQQKELNHKKHYQQSNINSQSNVNKMARMTSEDVNNLTASDFQSGLEKQLFSQLEKEKKKHVEDQQTIENLMKKLDDMMDLKKKYDQLKKANKELKQITKDELAQHIQMQKQIEAEVIYLSARNANLEEQQEELDNILDQKDYEIAMLNQSLQLIERKVSGNVIGRSNTFGNQEATLDHMMNEEGSMDNGEEYYYHDQDGDQPPLSAEDAEDEIDFVAEILDDEDLFDDEVFDDLEEDDEAISKQPSLISEQMRQQSRQNSNDPSKQTPKSPRVKRNEKKDDEETRDKKAFDKIKEYLHLTASAVKIKYPTVKNIQSDELIKRVKELPFYKYHDQMVRIMEAQLKKLRDAERAKNQQLQTQDEQFDDGPPPALGKRRSFLSIFNIFGGGNDDQSDNEGFDDNKSDISESEEPNDNGISSRRDRRKSKSRKKKRSFKKKKRKKSLSMEQKDIPDTNDNYTPKSDYRGGGNRFARGMSAEMSQKRLKNNK